jgi:hypothetical protein
MGPRRRLAVIGKHVPMMEWNPGEAVKNSHPKIFIGKFRPYEWDRVVKGVDRLLGLAGQRAPAVRHGLRELVPEYRPGAES